MDTTRTPGLFDQPVYTPPALRTAQQPQPPADPAIFGEVVATSVSAFMAQSYRLNDAPPFGGIVSVRDKAGTGDIFGAVYFIQTGGIDPGRRATPRATSTSSDDDIYIANPQLARLLKTEWAVLILGRRLGKADLRTGEIVVGKIAHVFPDYPPPLHYGVRLCADDVIADFTATPLFLRTILSGASVSAGEGSVPVEELTAAILRRGAEARGGADSAGGRAFLVTMGRSLARLLKDDYDRLRVILEKADV